MPRFPSRPRYRCWIFLIATLGPIPWAQADAPISIRWEHETGARTTAVGLVGLSPDLLVDLQAKNQTAKDWAATLAIELDYEGSSPGDRPAMLGTYRVEGDVLRFRPRFPLDLGRTYRATYRKGAGPHQILWKHLDIRPVRPATAITRVDPPGDRLPENLLKFYIHFSAPMGRGEAYPHLRLIRVDGKAVDKPFLELGEELWDPTGTRLTLLFDPGRIKRGLRPREEMGPILEAGQTYTLIIDPAWRDAEGLPLASPIRKSFRAEAADEVQPDPKNWDVIRPLPTTRDPIILTFPEPLDRALLESGLELIDERGRPVPGLASVDTDQRRWKFTPVAAWISGQYEMLIDSDIEDLAGNSIRRPFEVDIQRDTPTRPEAKAVRLPISIGQTKPRN